MPIKVIIKPLDKGFLLLLHEMDERKGVRIKEIGCETFESVVNTIRPLLEGGLIKNNFFYP